MLLGQLIRNTSAKVILHSGWKFWFDSEVKPLRREAERLISMLEKEGIKVNGVTPDHTTEEIRKSKKIVIVNMHTLKFQSSGEIESTHEFEVS